MTWPNLTISDMESRVRTYLNEVTEDFYLQEEIWRSISIAAKEISEKTMCVRRILTASTGGKYVRNILTNNYKVLFVEYIPSSGRNRILPRTSPLQLGRRKLDGSEPQVWFEHGTSIGIEPTPDGIYGIRVYVSDLAKLITETTWSDWTAGARWVVGDTAIHSGASSDITYDTTITAGTNYTFEFNVIAIDDTLTISAGTIESDDITVPGNYIKSLQSNGTALKMTATGNVTVGSVNILKEGDITSGTERYELAPEWSHQLVLYAAYCGLVKRKNYSAANLLQGLYGNEFNYLMKNIVMVFPDEKDALNYR